MSKKNIGAVQVQQYSLVVYDKNDLDLLLNYNVKRWAYILHDKDKNDDGTPAEPHYHLFLSFLSPRRKLWLDTFKAIKKPSQNIFCEPCRDLDALLLYFTHFNDPDKYQYLRDSIQSNFALDEAEQITHKRYELYQQLKQMANNKGDWLDIYENDPDLLFSACALDRAYDQIKTAMQNREYKAMQEKARLQSLQRNLTFDDIKKRDSIEDIFDN